MMDRLVKGKKLSRPKAWWYGDPGLGKSSLAACARNPIFVQTEDRLEAVGPDRVRVSSLNETQHLLTELLDTEYESVAVDTLDMLEVFIHNAICEQKKANCVEEIDQGFSRWVKYAGVEWNGIIGQLEQLQQHPKHPKTIILLSHAVVQTVPDPTMSSYTRWQPSVHKDAMVRLAGWVDVIGFIRKTVMPVESKEGFNKVRTIAEGGDTREVLYDGALSVYAKNCGMTAVQPFEEGKAWATFAAEYAAARKGKGVANADATK